MMKILILFCVAKWGAYGARCAAPGRDAPAGYRHRHDNAPDRWHAGSKLGV